MVVVIVAGLEWVKLLAFCEFVVVAADNGVTAGSGRVDLVEVRHFAATKFANTGIIVARNGASSGGEAGQEGERVEKRETHDEVADAYDGLWGRLGVKRRAKGWEGFYGLAPEWKAPIRGV